MADEPPPPHNPYASPAAPPPVAPFGGPLPPPAPPPPTDAKATASLALGLISVFGTLCFGGLFLGIPAVVLGLLARRDVRRSGGMLGGSGVAAVGIATGAIGSLLTVIWATLALGGILTGIVSAARTATHSPTSAPTVAGTTPTMPSASTTIHVVDLAPSRPLHDQLAEQVKEAAARGQSVLVQTTAHWCQPCRSIAAGLGDPRMEAALADVTLVRIDVDRFASELAANHMEDDGVPWFYRLDSTARPIDAISGAEWDDDVPENVAPVLGAFVKGKYTTRRHPSPVGTAL